MKNSQSKNQVQTGKATFTQEEVNEIVRKRLVRAKHQFEREMESKIIQVKIVN